MSKRCEQKFLICETCGNMVGLINDSGAPLICCGQPMEELIANTQDAAVEKHVPDVTISGDTINVTIGSVEHPMLEEHFITWIYLKTEKGGQRRCLSPGMPPKATFKLTDGDTPLEVYEYCNLHGLWKKEL
ncbi:desulfoferrodoxin [Clostridia bacterium OttesenSCG-928-F22]|nr:desulfoferrodoxin [Clostridia bacterium OttesenSCG-928-F22]